MSSVERAGVRLGVDVGDARVGLAASDPDALLATPVMTLRRDLKRSSDQRLLLKIAQDRNARQIYVGLPLSLSGNWTPSTQKAQDYAVALVQRITEAELDIGVRLVDERFSTVTASRKLRESGMKAKEQKPEIDQAAAVEILNYSLELFHRHGTEPGSEPVTSLS